MDPTVVYQQSYRAFKSQIADYPPLKEAFSGCQLLRLETPSCATLTETHPFYGQVYELSAAVVKVNNPKLAQALEALLSALKKVNKYLLVSGHGTRQLQFPQSLVMLRGMDSTLGVASPSSGTEQSFVSRYHELIFSTDQVAENPFCLQRFLYDPQTICLHTITSSERVVEVLIGTIIDLWPRKCDEPHPARVAYIWKMVTDPELFYSSKRSLLTSTFLHHNLVKDVHQIVWISMEDTPSNKHFAEALEFSIHPGLESGKLCLRKELSPPPFKVSFKGLAKRFEQHVEIITAGLCKC